MRAAAPLLAFAAVCACLAGCGDLGMDRQAKYTPQSPAPLFASGGESQAAPEGAVALGGPQAEAQAVVPPPVTLAFVQRGRERHAVACTPCHGELGRGDGSAVQRGFPAPQPYDAPHMRALSARQIYDAITEGYGVMYPQAERVEPRDRWAVVAYIRALQIAQRSGAPAAPGPPPVAVR